MGEEEVAVRLRGGGWLKGHNGRGTANFFEFIHCAYHQMLQSIGSVWMLYCLKIHQEV